LVKRTSRFEKSGGRPEDCLVLPQKEMGASKGFLAKKWRGEGRDKLKSNRRTGQQEEKDRKADGTQSGMGG